MRGIWVQKRKEFPCSSLCVLFPHLLAALLKCHLNMVLIDSLLVLLSVHQSALERLFLANLGLCAHWLLLNRFLWLLTIIFFRWAIKKSLLVNLDVKGVPSFFLFLLQRLGSLEFFFNTWGYVDLTW